MQRARKKTFLLLEVLLALTLVMLCAIPLVLKPIQAYRAELCFLKEAEGERLADLTFSEIKEQLYKNTIPWEKLPALNETTPPMKLSSASIHIPGKDPRRIERFVTFYGKGEKQGLNGETYRMLYVKIHFTPELSLKKKGKFYSYRVAVRLLPEQINIAV